MHGLEDFSGEGSAVSHGSLSNREEKLRVGNSSIFIILEASFVVQQHFSWAQS